MKYLCMAYEEERKLNELSESEWHALRKETLDYVESLRTSGRLIDHAPAAERHHGVHGARSKAARWR
jgi:hypothetical protein